MTTLVLPARHAVRATPRTRLLTLDLEQHEFPFEAGQAVYAGLADGIIRRPYSIASSPTDSRRMRAFELLVQIDDHAAPDPHLEQVVPGTPLRIEGPFGSFGMPLPVAEEHVLFVAGGTGIAPLRSMLGELLERQPATPVALLYSARRPDEFAFRDELERLVGTGRLEVRLTVTRDHDEGWSGSRGRIDHALIQSMLKTADTRCALCGPAALVTDAIALLKAAGVAAEKIAWQAA